MNRPIKKSGRNAEIEINDVLISVAKTRQKNQTSKKNGLNRKDRKTRLIVKYTASCVIWKCANLIRRSFFRFAAIELKHHFECDIIL